MAGGPITTGSNPKELFPGLDKIWGLKYEQWSNEFLSLFDKSSSERAYEEDEGITSFGLAPQKPEGTPTEFDSAQQFYITRYTNVTYALGFVITMEAMMDNLYMDKGDKYTKALSNSLEQTREIITHNIYNNGFDNTITYGDGQPFFSTAHPNVGGTFSNMLSPGADLSEASLEQMLIQINKATDTRNLKIALRGMSLHIPPELEYEATRILKNVNRPGTADRDINAMVKEGKFPGGLIVHHYLTDPDAYFIRTNVPDGVRYIERMAAKFSRDNEFDTENGKFKAMMRYCAGVTDPRAAYASAGA